HWIGSSRLHCEHLRRQHDQEDVSDERNCVDSVRKRTNIGASGALRELFCLHGVIDIADQDRNRGAGKNTAIDQLRRKSENEAAESPDQKKLNEIIERQPEKAVNIAPNDPAHPGEDTLTTANLRFKFRRATRLVQRRYSRSNLLQT